MPSLDELMKAAQSVQQQMQAAQAKLDQIEVEGASGGGMVKVRASARGRILGVAIDASLLTPDSKEMVEDLVKAAHSDARRKLDDAMADAMKQATGGLGGMLPGFKLPF